MRRTPNSSARAAAGGRLILKPADHLARIDVHRAGLLRVVLLEEVVPLGLRANGVRISNPVLVVVEVRPDVALKVRVDSLLQCQMLRAEPYDPETPVPAGALPVLRFFGEAEPDVFTPIQDGETVERSVEEPARPEQTDPLSLDLRRRCHSTFFRLT